MLAAFNDRLYDATDGQWRIARFLIQHVESELGGEDPGVGHFHDQFSDHHGDDTEHGHSTRRPDRPERFHLGLDRFPDTEEGARRYAGAFLMDFLHSWTGLKDEYETGHGEPTHCPLDGGVARDAAACVMDDTEDSSANELCRPETHNPDTEQGHEHGMDCYRWLAKVMREAGHPGFRVPRTHIPGPASAPPLHFVHLEIAQVRKASDYRGVGDDGLYARVGMDGAQFADSRLLARAGGARTDWFFGLAYSSDRARRITIRAAGARPESAPATPPAPCLDPADGDRW